MLGGRYRPLDESDVQRIHAAAVHIVDPRTREYRESNLRDLYDIARLVDTLEHIHFLQRTIVCRDMEDPRDLDLDTCYAAISGTSKHVESSWVQPEHVDESLAMLHRVAGDEARWPPAHPLPVMLPSLPDG